MIRTLFAAAVLAVFAGSQALAHDDKPKAGAASAKDAGQKKPDDGKADRKDETKKSGHGHDKKH